MLIVCHQVVVLCMRYILEELDEAQILAIDKQAEVLNCGICAYDFEPDATALCVPKLALWNHGAPLEDEGTPKTAEPDAMTGYAMSRPTAADRGRAQAPSAAAGRGGRQG